MRCAAPGLSTLTKSFGLNRLSRSCPSPCLIVKLTNDEAAKILSTFDAIGGLAEVDPELLRSLNEGMEWQSDDLANLIEQTLQDADELLDHIRPLPESRSGLISGARCAPGS